MAQRTSSRATKGQDTRIKLADEQAINKQNTSKKQAKKPVEQPVEQPIEQPRRQLRRRNEVQEEQPKTDNTNIPRAPRKSKKTEARILDIDLNDVPPSDDINFSKDFSYYTHPF